MQPDTWSKAILDYQFLLDTSIVLPDGVEWLYPYDDMRTRECMRMFYSKYYQDPAARWLILGINPGRFGAGITGVPFTDPIRLEEECGIANDFQKRQELSSVFVYQVVNALGGPQAFYQSFYITSVCPLGFLRDGKNYNYYDSRALTEAVEPMIIGNIEKQIELGARQSVVFSMGQGKNFKYLEQLNASRGYFEKVVPLPHPRWVMQYRLKRKEEFIGQYVNAFEDVLRSE